MIKEMWKKEADKSRGKIAYKTTQFETGSHPDELLLGRRLRNEQRLMHTLPVETEEFKKNHRLLKER